MGFFLTHKCMYFERYATMPWSLQRKGFNNDPEIIATITRSVKRGGGGKRRRGRSLFPAPRVFRLHFHDRFPLLHYSNLEPATG